MTYQPLALGYYAIERVGRTLDLLSFGPVGWRGAQEGSSPTASQLHASIAGEFDLGVLYVPRPHVYHVYTLRTIVGYMHVRHSTPIRELQPSFTITDIDAMWTALMLMQEI